MDSRIERERRKKNGRDMGKDLMNAKLLFDSNIRISANNCAGSKIHTPLIKSYWRWPMCFCAKWFLVSSFSGFGLCTLEITKIHCYISIVRILSFNQFQCTIILILSRHFQSFTMLSFAKYLFA